MGKTKGLMFLKRGWMLFKKRFFNKDDSFVKILFFYAILIFMVFVSVYPLLNILSISLRPGSNLYTDSLKIIPDGATLENFKKMLFGIEGRYNELEISFRSFIESDFMGYLKNSLSISLVSTVVTVLLSVTAAYAFSRYKFRGKGVLLSSFLITQIFPAPMLLLPTYILLYKLGFIGKFWTLVIPYVATAVPFCVWTLKGFFDTVPFSIEESAYVDGANLRQIFFRIVMPLSLPAIGVASLFAFTNAWNEYIVARIILSERSMYTLPIALTNMSGSFNTDWGIFAAASLITAIPVIVVFIALSKFMVNGLTLGGVKG